MTGRPSPTRQPNPLIASLASCLVVVVTGLACAGVVAGGYYLYSRRALPTQPAVEYILDASPRMAEPAQIDGGTRLGVAQGVLAEIVRPADPKLTAGLRVFGTGALPQACQDTRLVVPLAIAVQAQISTQLLGLTTGPSADAAVGEAMVSAIRDLGTTLGPHTLVVVTGGDDSCNPEAGQLIAAEAARAGIRLQLFVVGYQVPDDQGDAIKGLVDDAGGGAYINTHTKAELEQVLAAIQHHVDNPAANSATGVIATAQSVSGPGDVFTAPTASAGGGGGGGGGGGSPAMATETPVAKSTSASAAGTAIGATEAATSGDGKPTSPVSASGTSGGTKTSSPTVSPTRTRTRTPTRTLTASPTITGTRTITPTGLKPPTLTPTLGTVTATPTRTRTRTPVTGTVTFTPKPPSATFTPQPPTDTDTPEPPTATFTAPAPPEPFLNFGADSTSIQAGQCTNLHWDSGNVESVYLDGMGVEGVGARQVCPAVSTPYNLVANYPGGQLTRQVTVFVTGPPGPPVINSVNRSVEIFYEIEGCGPIEVTFTADISGAAGAQLVYRVIPSGGPASNWIPVPLNLQGGNTWVRIQHNFEMPVPFTGDVEYYVTANNAAGPSQSATFTGLVYSSCKP
jgi:hypothetical protein